MDLGQRLRSARQEAGLSQRQLCGGEITRNMLSLIENGAAKPSMDTLRYLSARLGKPVSYFLEETAILSPNQPVMEAARLAWEQGDGAGVMAALSGYRSPDPVFDAEHGLLCALGLLSMAEQAMRENRFPYAGELLERAGQQKSPYCTPELERRRLLLLAQARQEALPEIVEALPRDDRELMLRAKAALSQGDGARCAQFLEAALDKQAPQWNLLRGEAYFIRKEYASAAACYHRAEYVCPEQTAERLEECYRELGDYKMAYTYACKRREA